MRRFAPILLAALVLWATSDGLLRTVHEQTAHHHDHTALRTNPAYRSAVESAHPAHSCPLCQVLAAGMAALPTPETA